MAGCEQGWCGHHRLEDELLRESLGIPRPQSRPPLLWQDICSYIISWDVDSYLLSEDIISRESTTEQNPDGIKLPKFWTYSEFINSDFFRSYYDLWINDIKTLGLYDVIEPRLPDEISMKIQRMLLILGYLQLEDFDRSRAFIEDGVFENEISYFWILMYNEKFALESLQQNYGLQVDGIVWRDTRALMYLLVYHFFHSEERESCKREYHEMLSELQKDIED